MVLTLPPDDCTWKFNKCIFERRRMVEILVK